MAAKGMAILCTALPLIWSAYAAFSLACIFVPFLSRAIRHGKVLKDKGVLTGWWESLTVPKSWFTHFYILGFLCDGAGLVYMVQGWTPSAVCSTLNKQLQTEMALAALFFQLHLARRVYECVQVHAWTNSQMHTAAYVAGMTHYVLVATTFVSGGRLQQFSTFTATPRHCAAMVLFAAGNVGQHLAHRYLASLRTAAATGYAIPTAGMFKLVACPHYFWEVVIYGAVVLCTRGSSAAINTMALWSLLNLCIVANNVRAWYRQKFPEEYPPSCKRIFPYVW